MRGNTEFRVVFICDGLCICVGIITHTILHQLARCRDSMSAIPSLKGMDAQGSRGHTWETGSKLCSSCYASVGNDTYNIAKKSEQKKKKGSCEPRHNTPSQTERQADTRIQTRRALKLNSRPFNYILLLGSPLTMGPSQTSHPNPLAYSHWAITCCV